MFLLAVIVVMLIFLSLSIAGAAVESMGADELSSMGVAERSENSDHHFV